MIQQMHLTKQCADQVTEYVEHCRWIPYQHVSGRLHVAIRGGFEGNITAELPRMQALQKETLLLQHWTTIQLLQPLCNSHNVFPANQTKNR